MRTLTLRFFRTARVWLGEVPQAEYAGPVVTRSLPAVRARSSYDRYAAVELLIPKGGRFGYGLLGGRFQTGDSDRLIIDLSLSASEGPVFIGSLADRVDDVRIGLPSEYSQGVFEGIERIGNLRNHFMSGRLEIRCAAHGAVGSSPATFAVLSATLMRLVSLEAEPDDTALARLLEEELTGSE